MKKISLNGTWQFRATRLSENVTSDVTKWMQASVPGTVHTDLMDNGRIPDPFYRMNELEVQWVESADWRYRREFVVPESLLREDVVELVAEGLDTFADIKINGTTVGGAANMFVEHRFNVSRFLREGKNVIDILFDSPVVRSKALEEKHGSLGVALEPHRVYVRKAQYSFGWDWGPRLPTSGIWRDIYLEAFSIARLTNAFVKVVELRPARATLEIAVEISRLKNVPLSLNVSVVDEANSISHEARPHVRLRRIVRFRVNIPNPKLWWPNGYGDQAMCSAFISLQHDGRELDSLVVPFGIRTVRLVQERDEEGKSFVFEINGKKIYCKGADWIPSDNFIPRIPPSTYEKLLTMARDAHMNMIRVWGGGIYEQDRFYELCDRLGLMVWQDFMFACGEYPEQRWFLNQVREEAEKAVKRLRNHPSIVLWCGNNECEWLFCMANPGKSPDDMRGAKIFRDVLPSVCEEFDGSRPYWRSSPYGSGFPNDESNGNHHQWHVWSFWKDYKEYEKDAARFVTEFGFQAPANVKTFKDVTLPQDRNFQSAVMEHHNKQVEGTERLFRFQAAHYTVAKSFEEFVYKGQLVQAEALKTAVEHWRRRKFKTAGSLFWQLNDCWPVSSWAVIDSALRPKAAYYAAKRFFAPLLVSFKDAGENIEVWVTNDLLEPFRAMLRVSLRSFHGKVIWKISSNVSLSPNASKRLCQIRKKLAASADPRSCYLLVELKINGRLASENRFFFVEPKHFELPTARLVVQTGKGKGSSVAVRIKSNTFVKGVYLELAEGEVWFEDNYFDLDGGVTKEIRCNTKLAAEQVQRRLKISWLKG